MAFTEHLLWVNNGSKCFVHAVNGEEARKILEQERSGVRIKFCEDPPEGGHRPPRPAQMLASQGCGVVQADKA